MDKLTNYFQNKNLKDNDIEIKTSYIVNGKIISSSSNLNELDDINNGVLYEKEYFYKGKSIHRETEFDTRIEYTFIDLKDKNADYECPNCGHVSKIKDIEYGCPYCHSYYNIDYVDKEVGSKNHYDSILRSNTYKIVTLILDIIISFIIGFIFIIFTSRTFNINDIYKSIIIGIVLSIILYYAFYLLDGYIVLGPIKKYKAKLNKRMIDFWNNTKYDKKKFYNNLNYELSKYYYGKSDVIDYDIIDYVTLEDKSINGIHHIEALLDIRLISFKNGKIKSRIIRNKYLFKKCDNSISTNKDGINIIRCHNCGATIDATKDICDYCHKESNYLQEWILLK